MNKTKLIKRAGDVRLIIKGKKGQQLDEREIYTINNEGVPGLLYFTIEQKRSSFKLVYNLTGFITLRELLKNPLRRETFSKVLKNIFDILKAMQGMNFRQQKLYLDFDFVMVNPATQKLYFVYLPIQSFENGVSLRNFLLNIIQVGTFAADEERDYVKKYIGILNDGINFSVFELEQYISSLELEGRMQNQKKKCPKCHTETNPGAKYCSVCGTAMDEGNIMEKSKVYIPPDSVSAEKEDKGNTQNFTTVLGGGETSQAGATSVLGAGVFNMSAHPYLVRKSGNEKISIARSAFRMGKAGGQCDYYVSDNNAVSRNHADIITKNGRYYVIDLNSTNHTYVDDRIIQPEQETEIFSGTKIRLGDEEFTFYIEA